MNIQSKPLKLKFGSQKANKMEIEEDPTTKDQEEQNLIDLQIIEYLDDISFDDKKSSI
jgi:hypothetical protein